MIWFVCLNTSASSLPTPPRLPWALPTASSSTDPQPPHLPYPPSHVLLPHPNALAAALSKNIADDHPIPSFVVTASVLWRRLCMRGCFIWRFESSDSIVCCDSECYLMSFMHAWMFHLEIWIIRFRCMIWQRVFFDVVYACVDVSFGDLNHQFPLFVVKAGVLDVVYACMDILFGILELYVIIKRSFRYLKKTGSVIWVKSV